MKIVLDTNIWLSALFWKGEAFNLINRINKDHTIVFISKEIISEVKDILNRESKFDKFLKEKKQNIEDSIRTILSISELIETTSRIEIIKEHKADNIILELARDCNADYIISYNKHILNLVEFEDIRILSPTDFLKIL